ncbi:MAG: class I SAM-dependent RNA methyltransferase [Hellea sp.]|jgi:putative N6-adenine-specific DNA methylase|nr:class I SAM-dependent RNA methyltransferase [Hellea sp.]
MKQTDKFEIFITTQLGLEHLLHDEIKKFEFTNPVLLVGGVSITGDWVDVWKANMYLRGATKVLARIGEFRAFHLAQLDKRARKFPWHITIPQGISIKAEVVTNRKNKIYHAGAAVERIERAISEEIGSKIAGSVSSADIVFKIRIIDNNVIISIDTSGDGLYKRGYKLATGKAPIRENIASLALYYCGYTGNEPVLDPMCGSGTFIIEAAEISRNLMPGRNRKFSFQNLNSYDEKLVDYFVKKWENKISEFTFFGMDRNHNVVEHSIQNSKRAGIDDISNFKAQSIERLSRPKGPEGLVIVNPPYGSRIGKKKDLFSLYRTFGEKMKNEFSGWRVGMITSDNALAQSTKLPLISSELAISNGGLKIHLYRTETLA